MTLEPVPLRWPHLEPASEARRGRLEHADRAARGEPRERGEGFEGGDEEDAEGEGGRGRSGHVGHGGELLEVERARQLGRLEGLAETQALRRELAALCRALAEQRQALAAELAEAIVEVALVVVEAWLEGGDADRRARLAPVVARWTREIGAETLAIAQVAPDDAAALRELVGELRIEVRADPELLPGDVRLRSERSLLELRWRERLAELRGELVATLREAAVAAPSSLATSAASGPPSAASSSASVVATAAAPGGERAP